ncbi:MAG: XRE family transcriptional regulator [Chitinophagia bacterium]|nr:XRE family transcriptional regulator [Chitinophagia bacterium]
MKVPISENIRLIREAKGYSQEYVASKLKLTQQAYSVIEKNPENAKLLQLKELAKALDVNLFNLIGEDNVYLMQNYYQASGQAVQKLKFLMM